MDEPAAQVVVRGYAIECEVWIDAAPERVFAALTTPELLGAWWGDQDAYTTHDWHIAPIADTAWRCEIRLRDGQRHSIEGRVLEVRAGRCLRLSWRPSWDAQPETEVVFALLPLRGGTLLSLRHSGFRPDFVGLVTHRTGRPWLLRWMATRFATTF